MAANSENKQIAKELMIAVIEHLPNPAALFIVPTEANAPKNFSFEDVWNRILKTVSPT